MDLGGFSKEEHAGSVTDAGYPGATFYSAVKIDGKNPSTGRWIFSIYQKAHFHVKLGR